MANCQDLNVYKERTSKKFMIRAIISLLASVLTAVQAILLYTRGEGVCFNNGCEIVDSLTTVSPLAFNIAGFLYFQTLFWLLLKGRGGSDYWHKMARLLLLAGLVAEAVLIFFQYRIAMVFCSYCLIIFSFILLLNLLCGLRQIFRGVVLFAAVIIACFGLRFESAGGKGRSLTAGSVARLAGQENGTERYLFFSSTCSYCEKIIDSIRESNNCTIRFNPIDRLPAFQLEGAEFSAEYDPAINADFLRNLSITGVPALVAADKEKTLVLQGERQIMQYLDDNCRPERARPETREMDYGGSSRIAPSYDFSSGTSGGSGEPAGGSGQPAPDGSCPVAVDCEPADSEKNQGEDNR